MGLFRSIDVASTGLSAQRLRMDVISDNIANVTTTRTSEGGAFRRARVILRPRDDQPRYRTHFMPKQLRPGPGEGVRVVQVEKDTAPFRLMYDPTHPDAMQSGPKQGYVEMPNVNIVQEMADMISASRAYEANISMINTSKSMFRAALNISSRA